MFNDLDWMNRLCAQDHPSQSICKPFAVEMGGILWTVATNGQLMVAVQGEAGLVDPEARSSYYQATIDYLTKANVGKTVKFDDLRQWAGQATWPKELPCDRCTGEKQVVCKKCEGTGAGGVSECGECGRSHVCVCEYCDKGKIRCFTCDGSGKKDWKAPRRPGMLTGFIVDQELLAKALEHLEGQTVMIERFDLYLKISGAGWIVVAMGLVVSHEQVKSVFPEEADAVSGTD